MADDELIDMGWPDPQARPGVPTRPAARRSRSAGRSVAMARATIPTALMLLFLLPALGIGWLMLPGDAPLKIGRPALAGGLIGFGIFCGIAGVLLMRHVAREMGRRRSGEGL